MRPASYYSSSYHNTAQALCELPVHNWHINFSTAKLGELHKTVVTRQQGCLPYSAEESSLLNFHYSNLEFACGAELSQVQAYRHGESHGIGYGHVVRAALCVMSSLFVSVCN